MAKLNDYPNFQQALYYLREYTEHITELAETMQVIQKTEGFLEAVSHLDYDVYRCAVQLEDIAKYSKQNPAEKKRKAIELTVNALRSLADGLESIHFDEWQRYFEQIMNEEE